MNIIFVPEAKREFLDAISYYEAVRAGFGQRFKDEADHCILWVAEHSGLYRVRSGGYQRINLRVAAKRVSPAYYRFFHPSTHKALHSVCGPPAFNSLAIQGRGFDGELKVE